MVLTERTTERPRVLGVVAYFGVEPPDRDQLGFLLIALVVPLVVGIASVVGRGLAVDIGRYGGPLGMTAVAMLAGGSFTLVAALVTEGIPAFEPRAWLLILWLAAVNTAFTYTLWTQVLRSLRAVEASVLGDLTVLMTAVLGWLVLGEALGPVEIAGLVLTVVGVAIVQLAPMLRTREGLRARP